MSGRPDPLRGMLDVLRGSERQRSLLGAPVRKQSDRVVAMQDFLNRFQREMARQNIRRGDPLAPLLGLMGEMLLHFTHLTEDQTTNLDALVTRLNNGAEQFGWKVQALLVEGVQSALIDMHTSRHDLARDMQTIQQEIRKQVERTEAGIREINRERHLVHERVGQEAAMLLTEAAQRYGLWRSRVEAGCIAAVLLASVACAWFVAGNRGFDRGYGQGQAQGIAAVAMEQRRFQEALSHDDDPDAADHWLALIRWNDIQRTPAACAPQRSSAGGLLRRACTLTVWDGPPDTSPPAPLPGDDPAQSPAADTANHRVPRKIGPGVVEFR